MKHLNIICLIILPFCLSAQIIVERSIFSSLGTSNEGALNVDATFGESSIGLSKKGNHILTIGFHQTVEITDKIQNISDLSIAVYPNPANLDVNISSSSKIDKIAIISMSGTLYYIINSIQKEETRIDVSQFPKGVYILQLSTIDGQTKQEQIIVH